MDQGIALSVVGGDLAALEAVGVFGQRSLLDRAVAGGEEHEQVLAVLAHRQDGLHLLALLQPQPVDDRATARMRPGVGQLVHGQPEHPAGAGEGQQRVVGVRSEEHTSELQSLMRTSYAVFCLKKKKKKPKSKNT